MRQRRVDERGAIGGVEGLAFGVLVFVFGTLIIVNAWGVVDAKMATAAAAREAARAYVESDTAASAEQHSVAAATDVMRGHGRVVDAVTIDAAVAGDSFRRCQPITASVSTKVPRVPLPLLQRSGGDYTVTSTHSEVVDPYRSGIAGSANC